MLNLQNQIHRQSPKDQNDKVPTKNAKVRVKKSPRIIKQIDRKSLTMVADRNQLHPEKHPILGMEI